MKKSLARKMLFNSFLFPLIIILIAFLVFAASLYMSSGIDIEKMFFPASLSSGVSLILLFLYAIYISRSAKRISVPIMALARKMERLSAGNISGKEKEVKILAGTSELEALAHAFNYMLRRLKENNKKTSAQTAAYERIKGELNVAARIQLGMLPPFTPESLFNLKEIDLFARMCPANQLSGDFYDYFFIDRNRLAIVIADVSGQGIAAAMFTFMTKMILKTHLLSGLSCEEAVSMLNVQMCHDNQSSNFVTIWLCVLDINTGKLEYVNAGHNPPLLKSGNYSFRFLSSSTNDVVVGAFKDAVYHKHIVELNKGDELLLYTNGIPQAFNKNATMYGEGRLRDFFVSHYKMSAEVQVAELIENIKQFTSGVEQSDDITLIALRYLKETKDAEAGGAKK